MLNKCRNDVSKYGYDSRKNDSVMAFLLGGGKAPPPPAAFIPFYRLQLIGLKDLYYIGQFLDNTGMFLGSYFQKTDSIKKCLNGKIVQGD